MAGPEREHEHELRDVYDEATVVLLDAWLAPPAARARGWRKGTAAGMVVTALALGVQQVLEPEQRDPIVEEIELDAADHHQPVTVLLVPGNPRATVALVRSWLLRAS